MTTDQEKFDIEKLQRAAPSGPKNNSSGSNVLKPNVIKIEALTGDAIIRYLGSLERVGYSEVRQPIMQAQDKKSDDTLFYGILKAGIDQSWGVGATWQTQAGSGGLLGHVKALVNKVPVIGPGMDIVEGVAKLGERLAGVNTTATGSATMKNYGGATLTTSSVTTAWYLPEQYDMCQKGLRTLLRMAYPKSVDEKTFLDSFKTMTSNIDKTIGPAFEAATAPLTALVGLGGSAPTDEKKPEPQPTPNGGLNSLALVGKAVEFGMEAGFALNKLFGRNLTFDPVPVRLYIGQYIDVEPLIITGVKIKFSRELFISNRTSNNVRLHVPIFCEAEITFDYWLNPGPDMQYMKLLGSEVFGPASDITYAK